jgi:hypothetical protein
LVTTPVNTAPVSVARSADNPLSTSLLEITEAKWALGTRVIAPVRSGNKAKVSDTD